MTETITLPMSPAMFWGILTLGGAGLAVLLVFGLLLPLNGRSPAALEQLQERLGLSGLNPGVFLIAMVLWGVLLLLLVSGLYALVWEVLWQTTVDPDRLWDFRFLLAQTVTLTTVLGAVVALPFTLIRISLTRAQNRTAEESLFNDKINAATEDLYAQRQVTEDERDIWQDDVTRRNAAIDRLEGLVRERPEEAARVSRLLSVYIRALSRDFPPATHPYLRVYDLMHPTDFSKPLTEDKAIAELGVRREDAQLVALENWARNLLPARSDMESAAQVLGRLAQIKGVDRNTLEIDLRRANLQGFNLEYSDFSRARFELAQIQGASLINASLDSAYLGEAQLQSAKLFGVVLRGANLDSAGLQLVQLYGAQMQSAHMPEARLQAADLSDADLSGAIMIAARLQIARFDRANLNNVEIRSANMLSAGLVNTQMQNVLIDGVVFGPATAVRDAVFRGSAFRAVDCSNSGFVQAQINEAFGDGSVDLGALKRPAHWSQERLDQPDFEDAWRAWQRSVGIDPGNPE